MEPQREITVKVVFQEDDFAKANDVTDFLGELVKVKSGAYTNMFMGNITEILDVTQCNDVPEELKDITVGIDGEIIEKTEEQASFYNNESQKKGIYGTADNHETTFYDGFIGEFAVRRYYGLPFKIKHYIDFTHDVDMGDYEIEVKSSRLKEPLTYLKDGYKVFVGVNEDIDGDVIMFTRLSPNLDYAYILGWIYSVNLDDYPIVKYGNMPVPAYCIHYKDLKHPQDLEGITTLDKF